MTSLNPVVKSGMGGFPGKREIVARPAANAMHKDMPLRGKIPSAWGMKRPKRRAGRHATVLFADVSGSTKLYEAAGDAIALDTINRMLADMRRATEAAGGRVVKTIGDEVMALFPTAAAAASAASQIQIADRPAADRRRHEARRAHRLPQRPGDPARQRRLRRHGEPGRAPGGAGHQGADHHLRGDRAGARRRATRTACAACTRSR